MRVLFVYTGMAVFGGTAQEGNERERVAMSGMQFGRVAVFSIVLSLISSMAWAGVAAEYQVDFTTTGAPKTGWSYLWNANGPIGNPANYVTLVRDTNFGGDFETQANGAIPDSPPASNLAATATSVFPGQGTSQAADAIERYVIAAYTVSAADIATLGNQGVMDTYRFAVPAESLDGINAAIYVNASPIIAIHLPGPIDYNNTLPGAYPVPLGTLAAGDTIYVAIGSGATDTGDRLDVNYTITLVPEPGTIGISGIIAVLAMRRRGR